MTRLNEDNDLFFGLKGAGSSFGIATEFLYTVYKEPETLSVFLLLNIKDHRDILKLRRLVDEGRYAVSIYSFQHFMNLEISPSNLVSNLYVW